MMRRFFRLLFTLVLLALIFFVLTGAWLVFDGLNDTGDKADVALVTGHWNSKGDAPENRSHIELDRVAELYQKNEFPIMVLSVMTQPGGEDETPAMSKYLESHGVPSSAIIEDSGVENTQTTAVHMADRMKRLGFHNVMLVTDYYHVARMKLALRHAGITEVQSVHVGKFQKEDALKIGRETVAFYAYVGEYYLLPAAKEVQEEAQVGAKKASVEAEKARDTVNQKLDNLSK